MQVEMQHQILLPRVGLVQLDPAPAPAPAPALAPASAPASAPALTLLARVGLVQLDPSQAARQCRLPSSFTQLPRHLNPHLRGPWEGWMSAWELLGCSHLGDSRSASRPTPGPVPTKSAPIQVRTPT